MSAICPRRPEPASGGFSLLELLVVLALMSFVTALVAPSLAHTVAAISRSGDRAEAARQLERLPLLARANGEAVEIAKDETLVAPGFVLPKGWSVKALAPVEVRSNGYCFSSTLAVTTPDGTADWQLNAPDCRVSDAP